MLRGKIRVEAKVYSDLTKGQDKNGNDTEQRVSLSIKGKNLL